MKNPLLLLLAFAGCADGNPGVSRATGGAPDEIAERVIRIGVEDGDAAYVFSSIAGVGVTGAGTIVAADMATGQVRFFSPAGTWLSTTGRRGGGPDEFASPWVVGCSLPDITVFDPGLGRITTLSPTGEIRASVRTRVEGRPIGAHDDSTFWVQHDEINVRDARYRFEFLLVNSHTGLARTVYEVDAGGGAIRQEGRNTIIALPPRSAHPVAAACGGSLFLLTAEATHVDRITPEGGRVRTEIPAPSRGKDIVPLIAATGEADLWIASPAQYGLRVWTEYRGGSKYSWVLPESFRPAGMMRGGRVLGVERDSMDVEYAAAYILRDD